MLVKLQSSSSPCYICLNVKLSIKINFQNANQLHQNNSNKNIPWAFSEVRWCIQRNFSASRSTSTYFRKSPWDIFILIVLMQLIRILKVDFYRRLDIEANVTWTRAWLGFHRHHEVAHTLQFNLRPANSWFFKIPFLFFPCLEQKILQALNATVAAHLEQFGPDLLLYETKLGASLKPLNRPPAASPIIEILKYSEGKTLPKVDFFEIEKDFLQMKFTIKNLEP